ncbi:MAG: DnaJ domain-containing protein [Ktedonobacteraceae bacterium]
MSMDTPDNYYAILGVPIDAESDTLKRAYRQLARRYHPDLAGPEGAVQMKRINRAYDVLSDPEKRLNYDTIIGGVIDLREGGLSRPRPRVHKFDLTDDIEFSGLRIFSTKGPLQAGPVLHTSLGVISALGSVSTDNGTLIAAGSLDGMGLLWNSAITCDYLSPGQGAGRVQASSTHFAADPALTVESLRELRFSANGALLAGWGRLGLHVWNSKDGSLVWSHRLMQRAVSAHYSLDMVLTQTDNGQSEVVLALPLLPEDGLGPRALGVRATDVVKHVIGRPQDELTIPIICAEEDIEKRQFWAIRLRTLAEDGQTLCTLSCAHVPGENDEMAVARRWNLGTRGMRTTRTRFGGKTQPRPQISASVVMGRCADFTPPYAVTNNANVLALAYGGQKVRLYDTATGAFSELASNTMGGSARMAISPDAQWLAIAREDSEVTEGVIDLWSPNEGRIVQKLYHPWQISSLHFTDAALVVALTDGTIQVWQ